MKKDEYRKHFEMEEDFWRFRNQRKVILSTLSSFGRIDVVHGKKMAVHIFSP